MTEFKPNVDKVSAILLGISQAITYADQDAGNVAATSNWLSLIDAALSEANRLLTGCPMAWDGGAMNYLTPDEDESEVNHDA